MKRFMKTLCALTLSFALCLSFVPPAFAITPKMELPVPVFQRNNIAFPGEKNAPAKIEEDVVANLAKLDKGTVLLHFTMDTVKGLQTLFEMRKGQESGDGSFEVTISPDFVQFTFNTIFYTTSVRASKSFVPGEEYYVALAADPREPQAYAVFVNGEKLEFEKSPDMDVFFADLGGFDNGLIGGSLYEGYNAAGRLHSLQVYDTVISDDILPALTHITPNKNTIVHMQDAVISEESDPVKIPDEAIKLIIEKKPKEATFLIAFTPNADSAVNPDNVVGKYSLVGFVSDSNKDEYLHIYVDRRGFIAIEVRRPGQAEAQYAIEAPADVTAGKEHILAISANPEVGLKFYFDGALIYNMPIKILEGLKMEYQLFDALATMNSGFLGAMMYYTAPHDEHYHNYHGEIRDVKIWDTVLPEEELMAKTRVDTPEGIIRKAAAFSFEDWDTYGIRIPSLLLTQKGTLLAAGDIRFGVTEGSNDPPNNCDIGMLRSEDLGKTWSSPKMLLNFLDYPNEIQNPLKPDSASFCDSLMVQGPDGTIYYFCDAMSGNIRAVYADTGNGMVDATTLKLFLRNDSFKNDKYSYTVTMSDDKMWTVLTADGKTTDYTVDSANFDLYRSNQKVGNIFYCNWGTWNEKQVPGTTELRVLNTTYLIMMTSKDDGQTWSRPQIMNHLKDNDMAFFGTAPGVGYTIKTGKNAGRVLAPIYYDYKSNFPTLATVIYKDPGSDKWVRGEKPTGITTGDGTMGEIQIVEMPEEGPDVSTQLKMFIRESGGVIIATSYDGGETWSSDGKLEPGLVAPGKYSGCQQSVINYSKKVMVDGKEYDAVIFSNAAAQARANGTIRVGLINQDGIDPQTGRPEFSFTWHSKRVIRYGEFGYSCLAELPNGNIGILYEDQSRAANVAELVYAEYTMDYLLGDPKLPELIYEADKLDFPGTTTDYTIEYADKLFSNPSWTH